ncbi:hypothetical protein Kisp02_67990 [Kineosporia sp. NBRC 101731]|nr:hypothetical protein Kisp02_67990 [Kineosporia sp. NBRC 101731]
MGAELICPAWFTGPSGVPYVPTLGPVHPGEDAAGLIRDVFSVAGTGQVLPYDKDARWSRVKDEHIIGATLATGIFDQACQHGEHGQHGGGVVIPTLARRPHPRITLYCYGTDHAEIRRLAADLRAEHPGTPVHRVVLRSGATESIGGGAHAVRIWLYDFAAATGTDASDVRVPGVHVLGECFGPLVHSFADFAERMHADGWGFVRGQLRERDLGPILIRVHEHRVVAATGPLQIRADARGRPRLLPQYLGVLPEARGHGFGEDLRHAVTAWARQHGAEYELLQTVLGGPADRLHARLGARRLGTRHHQPAEHPGTC